MSKQINTTNWEVEFRHLFEGANASSKTIDSQVNFIKDLLASSQKDKEKEIESKINMLLLGIETFFESEKLRGDEEKRDLVRRDGGRTMSAFCFINQLKLELESLKSNERSK